MRLLAELKKINHQQPLHPSITAAQAEDPVYRMVHKILVAEQASSEEERLRACYACVDHVIKTNDTGFLSAVLEAFRKNNIFTKPGSGHPKPFSGKALQRILYAALAVKPPHTETIQLLLSLNIGGGRPYLVHSSVEGLLLEKQPRNFYKAFLRATVAENNKGFINLIANALPLIISNPSLQRKLIDLLISCSNGLAEKNPKSFSGGEASQIKKLIKEYAPDLQGALSITATPLFDLSYFRPSSTLEHPEDTKKEKKEKSKLPSLTSG